MRRVDPTVYTKKYYLTDCTGFNEFKKTFGNKLEPRFKEIVKYLEIKKGTKVLDIGCGRGEMAIYASKKGSDSIGIDYSRESIALANTAKRKQPFKIQKKIEFKVMDAKKLLFSDSSFDMIILTDVAEHLYPEELEIVFKEIKRVLKNKGSVIIHTAPNKLFNDIFYRFYSYPLGTIVVSLWNFIARRRYPNIAKPKDLRTDSHAVMHINEPTYFSLRNLFNEFKFSWIIESTNITTRKPILSFNDRIFNLIVFIDPLSRKFPLNILCGSDFISILKNIK